MQTLFWDPNPILFSLGPITIHWYGLFFAAGFIIGLFTLNKIFEYERKPKKELDDMFFYGLLFTVVGARLTHCIFYEPNYYFSNPLEVLKFWKGGLASHGGGAGLLLVLVHFSRKSKHISLIWLLDRVVIPTAFAAMLIRIANFVNSEIIGIPTNSNWGVVFQKIDDIPRHPAQIYEAGLYLCVFLILISLYVRIRRKLIPGSLFGLFLVLVFTGRFFIEFFKTQQSNVDISFISMGQILSIPYIFLGFIFLVKSIK